MPAVKAKAAKLPTCRSHFPQHLFRLHPYHAYAFWSAELGPDASEHNNELAE